MGKWLAWEFCVCTICKFWRFQRVAGDWSRWKLVLKWGRFKNGFYKGRNGKKMGIFWTAQLPCCAEAKRLRWRVFAEIFSFAWSTGLSNTFFWFEIRLKVVWLWLWSWLVLVILRSSCERFVKASFGVILGSWSWKNKNSKWFSKMLIGIWKMVKSAGASKKNAMPEIKLQNKNTFEANKWILLLSLDLHKFENLKFEAGLIF